MEAMEAAEDMAVAAAMEGVYCSVAFLLNVQSYSFSILGADTEAMVAKLL